MTRKIPAFASLALVLGLIGWDLAAYPPNPYQAPPLLALGSGQTAVGGFCGALPD